MLRRKALYPGNPAELAFTTPELTPFILHRRYRFAPLFSFPVLNEITPDGNLTPFTNKTRALRRQILDALREPEIS